MVVIVSATITILRRIERMAAAGEKRFTLCVLNRCASCVEQQESTSSRRTIEVAKWILMRDENRGNKIEYELVLYQN